MKLAILTPTFNRRKLLDRLYRTLLKQISYEFVWVVVNDGSPDDTDEFMSSLPYSEIPFEIRYISKINGGKARAVNIGLDHATDVDFVIIIDDDEMLYPTAVETILTYVNKYVNTDCGGIEFLRDGSNGKPIANYSRDDFFMSIPMRKRKKLYIDGYTGYFVKVLNNMRSPVFPDEKYIGPGVLQCMVSNCSKLLWPNKSIGTTEYLEGGLTKQGRLLRLKNPKGMALYSVLMQTKDSGFLYRFIYSAIGYAYLNYAKIKTKDAVAQGVDCKKYNPFAKPVGIGLSLYWKLKYKRRK